MVLVIGVLMVVHVSVSVWLCMLKVVVVVVMWVCMSIGLRTALH